MARRSRYAKNQPARPSRGRREKGELSVSYLGVAVVTAGIAATLIGSGIGGNVASATKTAVCGVTMGDCAAATKPATATPVTADGEKAADAKPATAAAPVIAGNDLRTNLLSQPMDQPIAPALGALPDEKKLSKFLRDHGFTIRYKPGHGSVNYKDEEVTVDPDSTPSARAAVYNEAMEVYYAKLYGLLNEEGTLRTIVDPKKESLNEYVEKQAEAVSDYVFVKMRTKQEQRKMGGGYGAEANRYQGAYDKAYTDAVNKARGHGDSGDLTPDAARLEQAGERAGREALTKAIKEAESEEYREHWNRVQPPKPAERRWTCAWLWHCG